MFETIVFIFMFVIMVGFPFQQVRQPLARHIVTLFFVIATVCTNIKQTLGNAISNCLLAHSFINHTTTNESSAWGYSLSHFNIVFLCMHQGWIKIQF